MLCNNIKDQNFSANIAKTKWLSYIENILQKAFDIDFLLKERNILVHCPSGDDGSSVLCSIAQILIDPYYRTFEGFKVLIYKEWIYF